MVISNNTSKNENVIILQETKGVHNFFLDGERSSTSAQVMATMAASPSSIVGNDNWKREVEREI